jgi:hypothetical protein
MWAHKVCIPNFLLILNNLTVSIRALSVYFASGEATGLL